MLKLADKQPVYIINHWPA